MTAIPRPLAADATVTIDSHERILTVKLAERGYAALLYQRGYGALVRNDRAPSVWAHAPGRRQIAYAQPGGDGTLKFRFAPGNPAYRELVSTPGLRALVTVDRSAGAILGVKFCHRRT